VRSHVPFHVPFHKPFQYFFATLFTLLKVGFTIMYFLFVMLQALLGLKPLVTSVTLEWMFSTVCHHVLVQVQHFFSTLFTLRKAGFWIMYVPYVALQMMLLLKHLVTRSK
jgi:hypothetical protein